MSISEKIKVEIKESFKELFSYNCDIEDITIDQTPKKFSGFYTLIIFPHLKELKLKPEEIGKRIGEYLLTNSTIELCAILWKVHNQHSEDMHLPLPKNGRVSFNKF